MRTSAGFYIAWSRWLDAEFGPGRLHKVGHTGDLGRRLLDSGYTTCFPEGSWSYCATFELPTKEDAFLLETAVLHCCRRRRLGGRELVQMGADELVALARAAAAALDLRPVHRERPKYAPPPARAAPDRAGPEEASEPTAWRAKKASVEALTVGAFSVSGGAPGPGPPPARAEDLGLPAALRPGPAAPRAVLTAPPPQAPLTPPAAGAGPGAGNMSDLIDEILSWEIMPGAPVPPAPEPAAPTSAAPAPAPPPKRTASAPSAQIAKPAPEPALKRAAPLRASAKAPSSPAPKAPDALLDELDDWDLLGAAQEAAGSPHDLAARPLEVRAYQRDAIERCVAELRRAGVATLQMACRCGKTPVAFGVLRTFHAALPAGEGPAPALYLVPGLSLLRQTAQKLAAYGYAEPMLLVGSDPRPVALPGRELAMTTDPAAVRAFLAGPGRRLVVCTYQSSPLLPPGAPFVLTVFDEAHRVCGGRAPRPFNHAVLAPPAGARLFMTATPAYDPLAPGAITMKDRAVFGGVAYRYHLRQGIAAGHVNDFRLELVAAPAPAPKGSDPALSDAVARVGALPDQLFAAMAKVDKLLVFCRDTKQAELLAKCLGAAALPRGVAPFDSLLAHSRLKPGEAAAALRRLAEPGVRAALFSCRMFQEGVEVPALNGVFFAAPRHSPRDIIQSVCRPLNAAPGKPPSLIFLPVVYDPARPPNDPANLKRFATIVPFVDALLDEDERLYEHLLDPEGHGYPLGILGAHTLGPLGERQRAVLLGAVRRAVRHNGRASAASERLLRVEAVPWERAFGEVRRVVVECGRYPKTTDLFVVGEAKASLHNFYRHYVTQYQKYRAGAAHSLEPYQIAALEALPHWETFGVEGPYPWKMCLAFLEQWLAEHGGEPPLLNLANGGYVGLDATAVERLAGLATLYNQQDGRAKKGKPPGSGFTVSPERQAEMDRICARFGLRWRKIRDATGALVKGAPKTFLQESHVRFKAYVKEHGEDSELIQRWYPQFPHKHRRMESLEVQKSGSAPMRKKPYRMRNQDLDGVLEDLAGPVSDVNSDEDA